MKRTVYTDALVWRAGRFERGSFAVEGGRIAADPVRRPGDEAVGLGGRHVVPGLVDVHVHLREPGFSHKETIATGTAAAARGGFTTVCAMPNLDPVPDSLPTLACQTALIRRDARVRVLPYAAITLGERGRELVDFEALAPCVVAFSDDGRGVQSEAMMEEAMRRAAAVDRPIAAHCEVDALVGGGSIRDGAYARAHGLRGIPAESEWRQVARDVALVEKTGCRYHVCHVSTRESVELVRQAQRRGLPVSCETAPHYLLLTDDDLRDEGRFKMNPPLGSAADRDALLEGIADGTIGAIATDHAPHTAEEKARGLAGSAFGVVGLECAFALLYTYLVLPGRIPFERLVDLMSVAPRRLFRLEGGLEAGDAADFTVLDLDADGVVDPAAFLSKGRATPFAGWPVRGRAWMTVVAGRCVHAADEVRKMPGADEAPLQQQI